MEKLQRIKKHDITLGIALPWPLYDVLGGITLQRGQIISSERHLDALLASGLYHGPSNTPAPSPAQDSYQPVAPVAPVANDVCFFDAIIRMPEYLNASLEAIKKGHADSQSRIIRLARELQQLCSTNHDAALGVVHLLQEGSYPIIHLLHTTILCELISERLGYRPERRLPLLCASLSSNISIIELQHRLHFQKQPLTNEQRELITNHPQESVRILQKAGITGDLWLQTVRQHHERVDGSGYGSQLSGTQIHMDARIVAIADIYAAMITPRDYRQAMSPKDALRELFLSRGKAVDHKLAEIFIKDLGVSPPGTFVQLNNGEKGIVTQRSRDHKQPQVAALLSPEGKRYAKPIARNGENTAYHIKRAVQNINGTTFDLKEVWGSVPIEIPK